MDGGFDLGGLLAGLGGAGAEGMGGGMDFFQRLMAATSTPMAKDQLLTKLAMSGIAPPPVGEVPTMSPAAPPMAMMPGTPLNTPAPPNPLMTGEAPPMVPMATPLQKSLASLQNPQVGPMSMPPVDNKPPELGQLLAGAQTAMKGMEQPRQERQTAPAMSGVGGHGSASLAKAPGYLPVDTATAKREQVRRSLGMLLGGR